MWIKARYEIKDFPFPDIFGPLVLILHASQFPVLSLFNTLINKPLCIGTTHDNKGMFNIGMLIFIFINGHNHFLTPTII